MSSSASVRAHSIGGNLTAALVHGLGREIVSGAFAVDPFPTEAQLAQRYGVSRTVAREAVKMLTGKGLLSGRPRHGTSVRPKGDWNLFDRDVLDWLFDARNRAHFEQHAMELRLAIEPDAAALAALYADDEDRQEISDVTARLRDAAIEQVGVLALIEFHDALLRASKNLFYLSHRQLISASLGSCGCSFRQGARWAAVIPYYIKISEAVVAGEADAARLAMRALILLTTRPEHREIRADQHRPAALIEN